MRTKAPCSESESFRLLMIRVSILLLLCCSVQGCSSALLDKTKGLEGMHNANNQGSSVMNPGTQAYRTSSRLLLQEITSTFFDTLRSAISASTPPPPSPQPEQGHFGPNPAVEVSFPDQVRTRLKSDTESTLVSSLFDILGSTSPSGSPPPPPPRASSSSPNPPPQLQVAFTPGRSPLLPPPPPQPFPPPPLPPAMAPAPLLQSVAPPPVQPPVPIAIISPPQSEPIVSQPAPQPPLSGSAQQLSSPAIPGGLQLSAPPIQAPMAASPSITEAPVSGNVNQRLGPGPVTSFPSSQNPPQGSPESNSVSGLGFNFPPSNRPSAYIVYTAAQRADSLDSVSAPSGAPSNGAVSATSGPSGQVPITTVPPTGLVGPLQNPTSLRALAPLTAAPASQPAGSAGLCQKTSSYLTSNPDLSTWLGLLQTRGLTAQLDDPSVSITMFAPVNAAFTDPVLEGTRFRATNVTDLLAQNPSAVAPIVGYHLVKRFYGPGALLPGTVLNTTSIFKQFNSTDQTLTLTVLPGDQVRGIGSTVDVIQPGVVTCGPQVIYVIDEVLVPFTLLDPSGEFLSASPPQVLASSRNLPSLGG